MKADQKIKVVAAGVTTALFASLLTTGIFYRNNELLKEDLTAEKVENESLLSEKARLQQEMQKLRKDFDNVKLRNGQLYGSLQNINHKLSESEGRVNKLVKENSALPALRREQQQLQKLRTELLAQLEGLQQENTMLKQDNAGLNVAIAELKRENERLTLIYKEKPLMAFNFLTEAHRKRNERLTVNAKRTHTVAVSFEIQDDPKLKAPYRLELQSPQGELLTGSLALLSEEPVTDAILYASTAQGLSTEGMPLKRINLTYDPDLKLEAGVYQLKVYNGNHYLGTTQFKLR